MPDLACGFYGQFQKAGIDPERGRCGLGLGGLRALQLMDAAFQAMA
jgi:hypothetical protein